MTTRELQGFLAWSALPGIGERSLLALLDHAAESRGTLADLWEAPLADLNAIVPLHPRTRAELERHAVERWEAASADAEAVATWGVDLLISGAPDAPSAVRALGRSWPFLFAFGAPELLEEPRVALVTSRDVSNHGLIVTDALADALARRDVALVASINRDTYKAAATAAKRHAGPSVLVLDRGIATVFHSGIEREPVAPARVWDESFDPDLQLLLSPFGWREPWHHRAGPRRDALILDLADVIVACDIRPGGNMERECLRAARSGKAVLTIDRSGSSAGPQLWEREPGIRRLAWEGAEAAIPSLMAALPERPELGDGREAKGRQREIAAFLARACRRFSEARGPSVGAYPADGPLAEAARSWSRPDRSSSAGYDWLLADLSQGEPRRLDGLLERTARGGLFAAVVPTAWLDAEAHAASRAGWLRGATLRLAVRLPSGPGGDSGATAAILLHRDMESAPVLTFAPEQERMSRFHLRRFLQEVLRRF